VSTGPGGPDARVLASRAAGAHTRGVRWEAETARCSLLLALVLSTLLVLLPVHGSAGSVTVLSTALAVALTASLLSRAPGGRRTPLRVDVSPDAPARDERCRRGSFRRQSSPDAPGRALPRAPQPA